MIHNGDSTCQPIFSFTFPDIWEDTLSGHLPKNLTPSNPIRTAWLEGVTWQRSDLSWDWGAGQKKCGGENQVLCWFLGCV